MKSERTLELREGKGGSVSPAKRVWRGGWMGGSGDGGDRMSILEEEPGKKNWV